ncbi:hypothetical protein JW926_03935 [Candidatus Sumerlaeota bacterium]|nr:hypothetical protein [Candidatus Sumerlaeota bacterium]
MMKQRFILYLLMFSSLMMGFLSGCASSSKPLFLHYDQDGNPIQEKRYRRFLTQDFKNRWFKTAYKKNNSTGPHFLLSPDQKVTKERFGAPDYISRKYLSMSKDYVKEWLYWEEGVMFQFVNRHLVYEGPLGDSERTLVLLGYPDYSAIYQSGADYTREVYYYRPIIGLSEKSYNFINGKQVDKILYR